MIFSTLVNILYWILQPVILLLPDIDSLPAGLNSSLDWLLSGLAGIQFFTPFIDDLISMVSTGLVLISFLIAFWVLNWVINKLRG